MSGAIPQRSVTIMGVPQTAASAAVFPKFSFCEGSTNRSASRYADHLASSYNGPTNRIRSFILNCSANAFSFETKPSPSSGPAKTRITSSGQLRPRCHWAKALSRRSGLFFEQVARKTGPFSYLWGFPTGDEKFLAPGGFRGPQFRFGVQQRMNL